MEIGTWIASERPSAAERIVDGLFDATARLEPFPLSGRRVPEFAERSDLRAIVFEQFRHTLQLMEAADLRE